MQSDRIGIQKLFNLSIFIASIRNIDRNQICSAHKPYFHFKFSPWGKSAAENKLPR